LIVRIILFQYGIFNVWPDEGVVTAGDIITDPDIEILNPDLKIATLDKDGRLSMEMTVG